MVQLVAGSGATQSQDEAENAPLEENNTTETTAKGEDNYGAGVPGPLTRLFVIANRGIANLIQDLILVSTNSYRSVSAASFIKPCR